MMRTMCCRALIRSAVSFAILPALAGASAQAATLPARADVRVSGCVDPVAFRGLVASRYHVEFNRVVAADIDRDGDIDVVATTDRTFTVWVNDGTGHLTSERPSQAPALNGAPAPTTWRDGEERPDPSTNDGAPAPQLLVALAHAPPAAASGRAAVRDFSPARSNRHRFSAPRAPPA